MVEKSKEYISCLANDKVGICVISLVLDRRHLKSDNKYPIALRFTIDRKRLYYSLGEKYTEKEFDAICRAKNTGRRTSTKNERETNFERKVQLERTFKSYVDIVQDLDKTGKFSYISKFHIIISCKLIVYIVMCFYQETN